jgi:hypothetical protein
VLSSISKDHRDKKEDFCSRKISRFNCNLAFFSFLESNGVIAGGAVIQRESSTGK